MLWPSSCTQARLGSLYRCQLRQYKGIRDWLVHTVGPTYATPDQPEQDAPPACNEGVANTPKKNERAHG
jgi:hypothetical protein